MHSVTADCSGDVLATVYTDVGALGIDGVTGETVCPSSECAEDGTTCEVLANLDGVLLGEVSGRTITVTSTTITGTCDEGESVEEETEMAEGACVTDDSEEESEGGVRFYCGLAGGVY